MQQKNGKVTYYRVMNSIDPPEYENYELEDDDDYTCTFLLFSGCKCYPEGGWSDFKGHFSTIKQALDFLKSDVDVCEREWFQIINIETRQVEMCAKDIS